MVVWRHHDQLISRTTKPLRPSPTAQSTGHSNEGSVVPEVAVPNVNRPEVTCGELEPPTTPEDPSLVPAIPVLRYPVRDRRPPYRYYQWTSPAPMNIYSKARCHIFFRNLRGRNVPLSCCSVSPNHVLIDSSCSVRLFKLFSRSIHYNLLMWQGEIKLVRDRGAFRC